MATTYTVPVTTLPDSKRQGLTNAIQLAINALERLDCREALLQLVNIRDDVASKSNPYRLDTTGETQPADSQDGQTEIGRFVRLVLRHGLVDAGERMPGVYTDESREAIQAEYRRQTGREMLSPKVEQKAPVKASVMDQYRAAKERHPGMMLMFRMGDFYELYEQDAQNAAKLLGLTLTSRDKSTMAGFPYHQLENYLQKLLKAGKRVAVCDQVGEVAKARPCQVERVVVEPKPATNHYAAIHAVDIAKVPVITTDRRIPRKEQAALTRKLFKSFGIKGVSVTTPNYSMASTVEVRVPEEPHPGWVGFEQWEHATYSDMPDDVPAKASMLRRSAAVQKIGEILAKAFPNHDDRSDSQSDYYDRCWGIS